MIDQGWRRLTRITNDELEKCTRCTNRDVTPLNSGIPIFLTSKGNESALNNREFVNSCVRLQCSTEGRETTFGSGYQEVPQGTQTLSAVKNCTVIYLCLFESFRRDYKWSEGGFRLTSLTINSHLRREREKSQVVSFLFQRTAVMKAENLSPMRVNS